MQKDAIVMKKLLALLLCGALAASAAAPVFAAESITCRTAVAKEEAIPDSALYYGRVKAIDRSEDGTVTRLLMESDRYGEYVFSVSADTVWVDDGGRSADDSGDLEVGEGLYIFHSLAETRSLPPQSAAFAIVRNTPMDVGCAMYYEVEAVSEENGRTRIQTNNGSLFITANENTEFSLYGSDEEVSAADLLPGSHIIAWNGVNAASFPAQTNALHIMLLPAVSWETLTRTAAAELVYQTAGQPPRRRGVQRRGGRLRLCPQRGVLGLPGGADFRRFHPAAANRDRRRSAENDCQTHSRRLIKSRRGEQRSPLFHIPLFLLFQRFLQRVDDNSQHLQPGIFFVGGFDDVPRRIFR